MNNLQTAFIIVMALFFGVIVMLYFTKKKKLNTELKQAEERFISEGGIRR